VRVVEYDREEVVVHVSNHCQLKRRGIIGGVVGLQAEPDSTSDRCVAYACVER